MTKNNYIMENTTPKLGIIESDPWLQPYSAAIEGRHKHAIDKELELTGGKKTYPISQAGICISDCTVQRKDGYCANGRPMQRKFTS